jgi:peptide/nickel transport system substrate-binding protein
MTPSRRISRVTRRRALGLAGASMLGIPLAGTSLVRAQGTPAAVDTIDEMVIDLANEPVSIDPAVAYAPVDWSVVHSIYDALIGFDDEGRIQPVAAERFDVVDDVTFEATLREGMLFHDGSPVTGDAVIRGMEHLQDGESLVADLFATVKTVEKVDELTVRLVCSEPSPWLPAQMAAWHVLLPEGFTGDSLANAPVGSGPYTFAS